MLRFLNRPVSFRALSHASTAFSPHSAHQLFDEFPQRTLLSFPAYPTTFSFRAAPHFDAAPQLFDETPQRTIRPFLTNPITFSKTISSCHASPFVISNFHSLAITSGLISRLPVSNSLINAYSKSGNSFSALKLFQTAPNRDTISWNTVISSLNCVIHAMNFLLQMLRTGFSLDAITLTTILSLLKQSRDFLSGLQIHSLALKTGFVSDRFISNALITFYSRAGFLQDAQKVFDEMTFQDLVSWNALICGFTQEGDNNGSIATQLFLKMLHESRVRPDKITVASIIPVCGSINLGHQIHCLSTKIGVSDDLSVSNVLISMYYKHGAIHSARNVFNQMNFRDVVSWTSVISMDPNNAVSLFNQMILNGVKPNLVTFVALLFAMPNNYFLVRDGGMIHAISYKLGLSNKINISNSLITMYARLGSMDYAQKMFDEMLERDIITWNALISGYQQNGLCEEALTKFSSLASFLKPNQFTFGSILSAITGAENLSLTFGQMCHCYIVKLGLNSNEFVSSALIDMYAKQGHLEDSDKLFNANVERSIISWTAIISAHAKHGNYEKVMGLFENMVNSEIAPDGFILLAVLMVCGSKGMVKKGKNIFNSIFHEYVIEPWPEHYSCMVDMLGKANKIQEAESLMNLMPGGPSLSALQSLLNACRIHGDAETGKRVADLLLEMDLNDSGAFVSISNVYAERGEWESVARVRKGMREKGLRKEVGFSWVDAGFLDGSLRLYKFASDDTSHPLAKKIYEIVESLGIEMKILQEDMDEEIDVLL